MTPRERTVLRSISKALRNNGNDAEMAAFAMLYLRHFPVVKLEVAAQLIDYVASGRVG